ncbi:hypothetical protein FH972_026250 [Carpinus fangiana]|uniref:RNA helicase n=1 Tax=Carpinus fangiana TaxID=176857 RepID=A0A5N6L3F0_9ROSI|nr:hypothetical protein FH972_026250 [Carpinus fangiana]
MVPHRMGGQHGRNKSGGFAGQKRKRNSFGEQKGHQQRSPSTSGKHMDASSWAGKARSKSNNLATSTGSAEKEPPKMNEQDLALRKSLSKLPIYSHTSEIRRALHEKDILLLVGETGSGKSTQVPQYLASEAWCTRCIAITQPRRVAAISLARRVAQELCGPPLGHPKCKVGYSVRFDQKVGPSCKIKFLTEGMLLQELLADPLLTQYSAIIVDEVHERSINVDLVLGFVKRMIEKGSKRKGAGKLKSVIMSATADVEALRNFFEPGKAEDGGESESSWSGLSTTSSEENTAVAKRRREHEIITARLTAVERENRKFANQSLCYIEGRQYPVEVNYLPEATQDFQEATLKTIFQIHYKEPLPGDILVFLTGQDTVEAVEALVNEYAAVMEPGLPKILALPLFAALPQTAQQAVFERTPAGHRKVVIATNIAETSVTIPGVRYVVDCGLAKVKEFRTQLGLDSLLVKPISKSSAVQRTGRAGREAPGKAYRLYTEQDYSKLDGATTPEILRCNLAAALLTMKARGIDDVVNFPFLTPPKIDALRKALMQLHRLRALGDDGTISETGKRMAQLPILPGLARVLIGAAQPDLQCVLPVIDIIACLSVDNIFLSITTEEKRDEAESARRELLRREGDHLTLLAAVQAYVAAADRKQWAKAHFVSHRAMSNVMNVRKQLQEQCKRYGLISKEIDVEGAGSEMSPERGVHVLQSFLLGFAANTARLMPDGSYRTMEGNQTVAIHPSSVLFGRKVEAILYNELRATSLPACCAAWKSTSAEALARSTPASARKQLCDAAKRAARAGYASTSSRRRAGVFQPWTQTAHGHG